MSYYINNKPSFLDQFTKAQDQLTQQVKGKNNATNRRIEELERECTEEKRKADEQCEAKIRNKEASMLTSIRDFNAKASSSIIDMQPYLLSESNKWEAPILKKDPTLEQIHFQAQQRTYLPQVLVGYQKYKYGSKHCILPTYVDWQSQDPQLSANIGNLILTYNRQKSSVQALNLADSMVTRMLMAFPAGNLRLSILDPTSMGEEQFTKMMNGCEELYSKKVYTNSAEIDKHLEILTNRIRDIKSNFSRTEPSLVLHNKRGIKQGYELVILYDPFNERPHYSANLKNLIVNGISAGIYVLIIQSDYIKSEVVRDFDFESFSGAIEVNEEQIMVHKSGIKWTGTGFQGRDLDICDVLPTVVSKSELIDPIDLTNGKSLAYEFYAALTRGWKQATKSLTTKRWEDWVESYDEADVKCLTEGIEIPIGINADNKDEVYFRVEGGNTYAHSFVQGMTGSGKSKFLSGVISSIAMKYSPKAVQMYLFDFKDGKAFECYMGVPHMRWLVTTQADKTMFLSVLKDLVAEKKYRSELFSSTKVGELEAYNKKMLEQGKECLPRLLLVVDECQDIYKSSRNTLNSKQKEINQIFEEIAKKYRAFGIHLLLASQQIPSDMTWIGQLGNNYILNVGNESFSSLLPADQKSKADEIQKRILAMPAATGIYSTSNKAYISMLGYENYREAGSFIRVRAEKLLGNEINRFESKVWDGKLNVPYFKTMTTASLEFGTNTIGTQTVGTFIEDKKKGNVLLYGSLGADRAKELTMRTVLTSLRGQFATRKLIANSNVWPTIYMVNAWEDMGDVVTNIWQQATENVLDKTNKILRNLNQGNFINLVNPSNLGGLLLQLKKQIENKEQKTILLYIIGSSEIEVLKPEVAIENSLAMIKEEPISKSTTSYGNWAQSSARPSFSTKKQEVGTDVLNLILQEGPNYGIHTILQVNTKSDMEERDLRSKDFQYFIFQQSKSFAYWPDNVTLELESALEDLPIDRDNARTLFYDSKNTDEEQFVVPLMIDELVTVANRGESVGEYIINNITIPNYGK